jgi:hypothetical protein
VEILEGPDAALAMLDERATSGRNGG